MGRKRKRKRALTVANLLEMSFDEMAFQDKWKDSFGTPEKSSRWMIWGQSGNGKTRFALQLAKYLAQFGQVAYNTLEEGAKKSFQRAIQQSDMSAVKDSFLILDREPIEELAKRLRKQRSPDIIFIDSLQYTGLDNMSYKDFVNEFDNKLFVFVSHADGRSPRGSVAKSARYDADVKIRVDGYKAFIVSRYGGGEDFVVWEEGAKDYWG